jgi:hypothetical protein
MATPDLNTYRAPCGVSTIDLIAGLAGNLLELLTYCKENGKRWPLDQQGENSREVDCRLLVMEAKHLLTKFPTEVVAQPVDDLPF